MLFYAASRTQTNENDLSAGLQRLGFVVVEAAKFTEQEKAYVFGAATVIVLTVGAGMTNLVRQ